MNDQEKILFLLNYRQERFVYYQDYKNMIKYIAFKMM